MSTQTIASGRAYHLADAVARMASLYGEARAIRAEEYVHCLNTGYRDRDRLVKATRMADRRYAALLRLTAALRDLSMKEER